MGKNLGQATQRCREERTLEEKWEIEPAKPPNTGHGVCRDSRENCLVSVPQPIILRDEDASCSGVFQNPLCPLLKKNINNSYNTHTHTPFVFLELIVINLPKQATSAQKRY